uniref:Ig-like domain-containing protein n=1 Tax=Poecilia reticulata TaxID=8081 RepID=A0A3P9N9D3_POERE
MRLFLTLFLFVCLFLSFLGDVSANPIITTVGTDVTLRCKYDAGYYGTLPFCWGRGNIPKSGCANEVLRSDGTNVLSRQSERYALTGDLGAGEASLTIRQVQESDSGIYGCRIDIPGWFNDQKLEITLTVNPGTLFTLETTSSTSESTTRRLSSFQSGSNSL